MYLLFDERLKSLVIDDIITTVKVFDGDLFGSTVRDIKIGNQPILKLKDIDIRIDFIYHIPFLKSLNLKYIVENILPNKEYNGITIHTYKIFPKITGLQFAPILIDLVLMTNKIFRISFLDFDVNLLTENDTGMYLRNVPYSMKYLSDKINYVKNRILHKTFSFIQIDRSVLDLAVIIEKAFAMTINNWTMDDHLHNTPTWTIGKWSGYVTGCHKKKYSKEKYNKMIACTECSLCQEKFKPNDIVLNTACNHNFHWMCSATGGLCMWVKNYQKICCPCCRSNMF
jgi:hypothetical protein